MAFGASRLASVSALKREAWRASSNFPRPKRPERQQKFATLVLATAAMKRDGDDNETLRTIGEAAKW